ncbi:sulfur carrier protein [Modicisalibacter ilicicola DSM 19980]|uniref:Sulfur carrier protein n=1 Tax=Modicisalibacter ilicicola DSM 19980 TaxID=1121942 RepID=A0A1M4SHT9_9GAMM|nr:sulfur carrier protein ThiS [Halomonas ilicicola]SHE31760.1 sulfur carrier protein [Halomonas ilicicola DSM 19980]
MNTITLSLNGESTTVPADTTLADALARWGYAGQRIAVAVDDEFVPRSAYASQRLQDNARIDIVAPIGGG